MVSHARRFMALLVLVAVSVSLSLTPALAQNQREMIDDSKRRVILVPGIKFTFETSQEDNACDRAFETFAGLVEVLTSAEVRKSETWSGLFKNHPEIPFYRADEIYAFDYSFDPEGLNTDPPVKFAGPCPNNNRYMGKSIRERLSDYNRLDYEPDELPPPLFEVPPAGAPEGPPVLTSGSSTRFAQQFKMWREDCPNCHFDIIAHSLGGAVVANWVANQATEEDLKYVHSLTTIDSPVNGGNLPGGLVGVIATVGNDLFALAGRAGEDLRNNDFIAKMRTAPTKFDMLCLSNIQDALITTHMATIRHNNNPARVQYDVLSFYGFFNDNEQSIFAGPCKNIVGRFSTGNPYDLLNTLGPNPLQFIDRLKEAAENAHGEPLRDPDAILFVLGQLASATPRWTARNNAFAAAISPITSPTVEPGGEVTIEVSLQNTGTYVWEAGVVKLQRITGQPFGLDKMQPLPTQVVPGAELPLRLKLRAPDQPGVYRNSWKLYYGNYEFGPSIAFDLVVQPRVNPDDPNSGPDFFAPLRALWERLIAEIQRQIEEARQRALEALYRELLRQICGVVPAIVFTGSGTALYWRWKRHAQRKEERDEY